MTQRVLFFILVLATLFFPSGNLGAQEPADEFSKAVYTENFDTYHGDWKLLSNADNLFLIQDGEYILHRKNTSTGYSIFTRWKCNYPAFELSARIKLETGNTPESSAGIVFMAQEDGSGAFVFEFNTHQQYRLKRLVGTNFKLLSGETRSGGWVSTDLLNSNPEENEISVRFVNRNYECLINEKHLLDFTELAYKSGQIGITVGPGTKARIRQFTVKVPEDTGDPSTADENVKVDTGDKTELPDTNTRERLLIENRQLRDSLLLLMDALSRCKSGQEESTDPKPRHGE